MTDQEAWADVIQRLTAVETLLTERSQTLAEVRDSLHTIEAGVKVIELGLSEARGEKKALYAIAALLGAFGGFLTTILTLLLK